MFYENVNASSHRKARLLPRSQNEPATLGETEPCGGNLPTARLGFSQYRDTSQHQSVQNSTSCSYDFHHPHKTLFLTYILSSLCHLDSSMYWFTHMSHRYHPDITHNPQAMYGEFYQYVKFVRTINLSVSPRLRETEILSLTITYLCLSSH